MVEPQTIESNYGFDLEHRDPTEKNKHIRVFFTDAFAEPDGTHSIDGVWGCSYNTFKAMKACCYMFLSCLCAGPCACYWGCLFGCQSFYHIWCVGPCCTSWKMDLGCCALYWRNIVECYLNPCYDSLGRIFGNIKFHHRYEVV